MVRANFLQFFVLHFGTGFGIIDEVDFVFQLRIRRIMHNMDNSPMIKIFITKLVIRVESFNCLREITYHMKK